MKSLTYFLLSSLTILLAYLVFRVFVRRDYERKKKLSALSTLLECLVFAAHANLSYAFLPAKWPALPAFPENDIQTAVGLGLVGTGTVFTIWAMSKLGLQKALGQKVDGLYQMSFYKYTRNPQIVAYGLIMLGSAIIWASLYSLGWVLIYCAIAHMMVITEEEHLRKIYGHDYEQYCRKVPRYIPMPWREKSSQPTSGSR